jgi:hypothetical protein
MMARRSPVDGPLDIANGLEDLRLHRDGLRHLLRRRLEQRRRTASSRNGVDQYGDGQSGDRGDREGDPVLARPILPEEGQEGHSTGAVGAAGIRQRSILAGGRIFLNLKKTYFPIVAGLVT